MTESTPSTTRRAERFEVVDAQGSVRAVLGILDHRGAGNGEARPRGATGGAGRVGLELRDASERPRATLAVDDDGAWMLLELEGNARLHFGVNDPAGDAVDARVFLYLCAPDGRPVVGWRIHDGGTAENAADLPGE